jgi:hypothetical protein
MQEYLLSSENAVSAWAPGKRKRRDQRHVVAGHPGW